MVRMLRRVAFVMVVGAVVAAVVRSSRLRGGAPPSFAPAAWPPFEPVAQPDSPASVLPVAWVLPVDGRPPEGYPVKANESSKIFHVPGGRFYDRTRAERCYADAEAAIADGYRAAKA
jgi:hypothetical protein